MSTLLLGLAVLAVLAFFSAAFRRHRHNSHVSLPRHKSNDPLFAMDFIFKSAGKMTFTYELLQYYGDTFELAPIVTPRRIFTKSPANTLCILKNGKSWGVQPARLSAMEPAYGRSFITMDGEAMIVSKKLIKPALSRQIPYGFASFATLVEDFINALPDGGKTVDVQPMIFQVFYRSALSFLLGIDAREDEVGAPISVSNFEQAWNQTLGHLGMRIMLPWIAAVMPTKKYKEALREFHGFLDHCIDQALHTTQSSKHEKSSRAGEDIAGSMLQEIAISNRDRYFLRSITSQTLLAANATTSWLVSNVIFLLSRHPMVWTQLRNTVLESKELVNQPDGFLHSGVSGNVFKEALRLYPLFPVINRTALEDTILPAGGGTSGDKPIPVYKNENVQANVYALHRDANVFGPDVEKFIPSRWDSINPSRSSEYLPFGTGTRACLGEHKALLESTYVLVQLAIKYERIESRDDRDWKGVFRATCRNGNGCLVAFHV